jgi:hypothetical protein
MFSRWVRPALNVLFCGCRLQYFYSLRVEPKLLLFYAGRTHSIILFMAGCAHSTVTLYKLHPPHTSPCCCRHLHQVIPLVGGTRRTQYLTATATRRGRRRGSLYQQQLAPTAGSPCRMRIRGRLHRPYAGAARRVQPAACPSAAGRAGSRRQLLRVQSAAAPRPLLGLHLQQVRGSARGGPSRTVGVQHSSARYILQPAGEGLFLVKPKSKLLSYVPHLVSYGRCTAEFRTHHACPGCWRQRGCEANRNRSQRI